MRCHSISFLFCACFLVAFSRAAAFAEVTATPKQSDCLQNGIDGPGEGQVSVEVKGCAVHILHSGVVVNCCLEYGGKVSVSGSTVEVTEVDSGPPCDCICPFDLELTVEGLDPGRYTLIFNAFLHGKPLEYTVEIPPCTGFWILADEVWSSMGTLGVVVPVRATNEKPLSGFSFGTTFPLRHARMAEINLEGTITEKVGAEMVVIDIHEIPGDPVEPAEPELGGATCSVILDAEAPFAGQTIPAGAGEKIANLVYDILPPSGSVPRSISVPFVEGLGKPPVPMVFSVAGEDVIPEKMGGIIQLSFPPSFIRGDANDNEMMSISDPIYLLEYLFRGGPVPPCEDSADANDDGSLDVADAIKILLYLFAGGSIPPPSPPGPAGFDPTLDELGCLRAEGS